MFRNASVVLQLLRSQSFVRAGFPLRMMWPKRFETCTDTVVTPCCWVSGFCCRRQLSAIAWKSAV